MLCTKVLLALAVLSQPLTTVAQCTSSTFNNVSLTGGQILNMSVRTVSNYSMSYGQWNNFYPVNVTGVNACEANITYTHPGFNDYITVTIWLPLSSWNGRFIANGGGGYRTGRGISDLVYPVSMGYAAAFTDGGHTLDGTATPTWGLASRGVPNWQLIQDFAAVSLDDMATLAKSAIQAFHGSLPRYSYWNGCSTGGRQGHMMAQRYPTQFNGILGTAPAFNWPSLLVADYYGQLTMNLMNKYPRTCEFDYITRAAIAACDELDGVKDGVIAKPGLCKFDPFSVVGNMFNCSSTGTNISVSSAAATAVQATWNGSVTVDGKFQWFGFTQDTPLTVILNTTCAANGTCTGNSFPYWPDWIRLFVIQDADFNVTNLTHRAYDSVFRLSNNIYQSILGTNDPDLTEFRDAGGKMLTWHGLSDPLIPANGTYNYYQRVLAQDPKAADYYRFFPAPGVGHCTGGLGWYPGSMFQSLVNWVENGTAPDTVDARSPATANGTVRSVKLCPYPQELTYTGGDANVASSFTCR